MLIDSLMENPFIYGLSQKVLAGDGHRAIKLYLSGSIKIKNGALLDLGCGNGDYSQVFKKLRYIGLDTNKLYINFAQKRYKNAEFVVGDATKVIFKDGSFDSVICVGLIHHLNDSQAKKAINESVRILKSSGKLIIVDAVWPLSRLNILGFVIRKLDRGRYVRKKENFFKLFKGIKNVEVGYLRTFPLDYVTAVISKRNN